MWKFRKKRWREKEQIITRMLLHKSNSEGVRNEIFAGYVMNSAQYYFIKMLEQQKNALMYDFFIIAIEVHCCELFSFKSNLKSNENILEIVYFSGFICMIIFSVVS